MSGRRLIGIDLAWGEENGSGCVELVWEEGELSLSRLDLLYSTDEIVEWIALERGDWVVAVDAPLVVLNETGKRAADEEASRLYRRFEVGVHPANRKVLAKYARGDEHRGEQLLRALQSGGARLAEREADVVADRLAFETHQHIVMVELFGLDRTIKRKKGKRKGEGDANRRRGQRQLCDAIREHLCGALASPRLQINDRLDQLFGEPDPTLKGAALRSREDLLDGLVCAYTAAWIDAGRPAQGLGEVGAGVIVTPELRGIREGRRRDLLMRRLEKRSEARRKMRRHAAFGVRDPGGLGWGTCRCGCGRATQATFAPGHDAKVASWLLRVERGRLSVASLPPEVWSLNLNQFFRGRFAALDLGPPPGSA